jgi:hypothetical protein
VKFLGVPAHDIVELGMRLSVVQPAQILGVYFDAASEDKRYEALVVLPESTTEPHVMHVTPWPDGKPIGGLA